MDLITLKGVRDNGLTVEVQVSGDAAMTDLAEAFKAFALAWGYQPETVNEQLYGGSGDHGENVLVNLDLDAGAPGEPGIGEGDPRRKRRRHHRKPAR
jgi:hypothetical protein